MAANTKTAFIAIAGPSGVGKGTILRRLLDTYPAAFEFSVSYTSRGPRPGEVDGVHYFFRSKEEIQAGKEKGEFIEVAEVHTNLYGTHVSEVERIRNAGKVCVLDIDVQGIKSVMASSMGNSGRYLVIEPPSMEELEQRLRGRGTETEEKVQTRLRNAVGEMETLRTLPTDRTIINDDLDQTVKIVLDQVRAWFPDALKKAEEIVRQHQQQAAVIATENNGGASDAVAPEGVAVVAEGQKKTCCTLQ